MFIVRMLKEGREVNALSNDIYIDLAGPQSDSIARRLLWEQLSMLDRLNGRGCKLLAKTIAHIFFNYRYSMGILRKCLHKIAHYNIYQKPTGNIKGDISIVGWNYDRVRAMGASMVCISNG